MRILIISDSHGYNDPLRTVIQREKPDMMIHLGDSQYSQAEIAKWAGAPKTPCVFVRGNCDTDCDPELVRDAAVFELKGHKFYCAHGHREHIDMGLLRISLAAQELGCDICMFGHTHVPYDSFGEAVSKFNRFYGGDGIASWPRLLNPGSISIPRGGSGNSYMIMEMEDDGRYEVKFCLLN